MPEREDTSEAILTTQNLVQALNKGVMGLIAVIFLGGFSFYWTQRETNIRNEVRFESIEKKLEGIEKVLSTQDSNKSLLDEIKEILDEDKKKEQ
jgi:hypothetical protein